MDALPPQLSRRPSVFGILQRRLLAANVLSGLGLALHASLAPRPLGAVLRSSIGDSAAQLLLRDPETGDWLHEDGSPAGDEDPPGPGRVLREIRGPGGPIAAIVIDASLEADDELVDSIVSLTEAALRETRLQRELDVSRSDLDDSRKRIPRRPRTSGARAASSATCTTARSSGWWRSAWRSRWPPRTGGSRIRRPRVALLGQARHRRRGRRWNEVRALARGGLPRLCSRTTGSGDALRMAARDSSLPTTVRSRGLGRYSPA